ELTEGEPVAGAQRIARVGPLGDGGDDEARRGRGRQVLQRVHGQVDLAGEEGIAQGGGEDPGAAETGERGAVGVALGDDVDQLDLVAGRAQRVGHVTGLGAGEDRAAGPQTKGGHRAPPSECRSKSWRRASSYSPRRPSTASSLARTVGWWSNLST